MAARARILLIEDNPDDALLVERALGVSAHEPVELEVRGRMADGVERLTQGGVDLVLLDLTLPDSSGLETLDRLRAAAAGAPVIVLTGLEADELGLEALRRGAQDFLSKDHLSGWVLASSIRHARERAGLVRELEERAAELARSNRELEEFASVVAHDLQEPLRMVSGFVELLQRRYGEQVDERGRGYIRDALDGAARMKGLIGALLGYSRAGGKAPQLTPQRLEEVLSEALRNLEARLGDADVSVDWDPLPVVEGNRVQLVQLFQNLIGNALKFRAEGPLRVHVESRTDGALCTVSVRDNGIGFEPEQAERLFQRFERLNPEGRVPGTGIGLYIARRVVEGHGGRIWAESAVGQGSVFHVTLRLASGASAAA
jgi:signal transduction histidine kinase